MTKTHAMWFAIGAVVAILLVRYTDILNGPAGVITKKS